MLPFKYRLHFCFSFTFSLTFLIAAHILLYWFVVAAALCGEIIVNSLDISFWRRGRDVTGARGRVFSPENFVFFRGLGYDKTLQITR